MKLSINEKTKTILLKDYYEETDFVVVKYINREIWNYINKLIMKTHEGLIYQEMSIQKEKYIRKLAELKKNKKCDELLEEIDKIDLKIKKNDFYFEAIANIDYNELEKAKESTKMVNKLLIENGLDKDNHSLEDDNGKLKLSYDLIDKIGYKIGKNGLDLYTFILNEIKLLNQGFDLGE